MNRDNKMVLEVESRSCNEGLARIAVAAFSTQLNPTLEEVADIKTAVSEAITNCIVHAYQKETDMITIECSRFQRELTVVVQDKGKGIEDVEKAMQPLFTTKPEQDRSGMGFAFMEAFMDEVLVESRLGEGTTVTMKKTIDRKTSLSRRAVWMISLPLSGVHTKEIRAQEIYLQRKIWGWYIVLPEDFKIEGLSWKT